MHTLMYQNSVFSVTIFLGLKNIIFVPKQSKNLDLSYKTDLDFLDCLGRVEFITI